MNYISKLSYIFVFCACMACSTTPAEDGLGHHHDHEHADHDDHDGHDDHDEDGDHDEHKHGDEITLSPEMAKKFGVKTSVLKPDDFAEVIKVSGQIVPASGDQIVVSATTNGIITIAPGINVGKSIAAGTTVATISAKGISGGDTNEAARLSRDAAKKELDRVTPLYKEGIVSEKDYNEAVKAYNTAAASYSAPAASGTATSRSSGVITRLLVTSGQYVATGEPIAIVSQNTRLTLRADLPEKYYNFLPTVSSANFRPSYSESTFSLADMGGSLLSAPSASTAQNGYIPVFFTFNNNGQAVPGAYAEIYLLGATAHDVISVPVEALTENQGVYYAYVKVHDDAYEKRRIVTGRSNGKSVEVISGLNAGDCVVSDGAAVIRMAETSGNVPEGHSHNH